MTGPRSTGGARYLLPGSCDTHRQQESRRRWLQREWWRTWRRLPYPNSSGTHTDHLLARSWARLVHMVNEGATPPKPKTRSSWPRAKGSRCARDLLERHSAPGVRVRQKMCGIRKTQEVAQDTLLSMVAIPCAISVARLRFRLGSTPLARSFCIKKRRRYQGSARAPRAARCGAPRAGFRAGNPARKQTLLGRETRRRCGRRLGPAGVEAREVVILRESRRADRPRKWRRSTGPQRGGGEKSRLHRCAAVAAAPSCWPVLAATAMRRPSRTVPDVLTMLSKKLEDEISPDLCAEMERHVDGCPHCKELCDSLNARWPCASLRPATGSPAGAGVVAQSRTGGAGTSNASRNPSADRGSIL